MEFWLSSTSFQSFWIFHSPSSIHQSAPSTRTSTRLTPMAPARSLTINQQKQACWPALRTSFAELIPMRRISVPKRFSSSHGREYRSGKAKVANARTSSTLSKSPWFPATTSRSSSFCTRRAASNGCRQRPASLVCPTFELALVSSHPTVATPAWRDRELTGFDTCRKHRTTASRVAGCIAWESWRKAKASKNPTMSHIKRNPHRLELALLAVAFSAIRRQHARTPATDSAASARTDFTATATAASGTRSRSGSLAPSTVTSAPPASPHNSKLTSWWLMDVLIPPSALWMGNSVRKFNSCRSSAASSGGCSRSPSGRSLTVIRSPAESSTTPATSGSPPARIFTSRSATSGWTFGISSPPKSRSAATFQPSTKVSKSRWTILLKSSRRLAPTAFKSRRVTGFSFRRALPTSSTRFTKRWASFYFLSRFAYPSAPSDQIWNLRICGTSRARQQHQRTVEDVEDSARLLLARERRSHLDDQQSWNHRQDESVLGRNGKLRWQHALRCNEWWQLWGEAENLFFIFFLNFSFSFAQCQCKNGFTYAASSPDSESAEICVDINECSSSHICSEFAECYNRNGGYDCVCFPGYEGNGYDCQKISQHEPTTPHYGQTMATCNECSENADCSEGVCVCNSGFIGNGHDCRMICAMNEVFNGASCIKVATVEEGELGNGN